MELLLREMVEPAQTLEGPLTTPVSDNGYTVFTTKTEAEHPFTTLLVAVTVVVAGAAPCTPPIVPVAELMVPTEMLDDVQV